VSKIQLYRPDGAEETDRPPESRLFRPNDTLEDLCAITQSLQESLIKEKALDDKLVKIKNMISKNIGKTHTDLLRLFENIKQEVMSQEPIDETSDARSAAYETVSSKSCNVLLLCFR
jgi:hypothetical protein